MARLPMKVISFRLNLDEIAALARLYGDRTLSSACRDLIRRSIGKPLDRRAGYEDGYAEGWSDAQTRVREAFKQAGAAFRVSDD